MVAVGVVIDQRVGNIVGELTTVWRLLGWGMLLVLLLLLLLGVVLLMKLGLLLLLLLM